MEIKKVTYLDVIKKYFTFVQTLPYMAKYISTALDRQVISYLKPREFMMFQAEREMLIRGESEHLREIIQAHFRDMTPVHQRQLLDYYQEKLIKKNKINP